VSNNQTSSAGVSGRYAIAVFDLAVERGVLNQVERDLAGLGRLIEESADLQRLLGSPIFGREEQAAAIAAVADKAELSDLTKGFLGLVAQNRRSGQLASIISAFAALAAERRGELTGHVVSASPLDEAQARALESSLADAMGQQVKLQTSVDDSLIGGLTVQVGSRMVDSSLRTKIRNLEVVMKGVG
jgi:F-type H+-transporting ATPase subunit delta